MRAFSADSEAAARALITEAANRYCGSDAFGCKSDLSKDDLEAIAGLMHGISPKDTLEAIYAAQIVASHMLGMRKLAESYSDDQRLGLQLLRFCNEAMQQLEKKRGGGSQNINVTYNHSGQGPAFMQTVIPKESDAN